MNAILERRSKRQQFPLGRQDKHRLKPAPVIRAGGSKTFRLTRSMLAAVRPAGNKPGPITAFLAVNQTGRNRQRMTVLEDHLEVIEIVDETQTKITSKLLKQKQRESQLKH